MNKLLLCTDLDRTLLPNGPQPASAQASELFNQLTRRPEVTLSYVTGRDPVLVEDAIKEYQIPLPDYVIADVGASIYRVKPNEWEHWPIWDNNIRQSWANHSHSDLKSLLSPFQELKIQEESKQSTFKLSYYVSLQVPHKELLEKIKIILVSKNIDANLIWSIDEEKNIGLLDVLPSSAGKREAIDFLSTQLKFKHHEVIFAGDSGNDISVMVSPIQAILVANANEDVKQEAITQAQTNGNSQQLYLAKGNFHGLNGNYCSGILEGVVHYMKQAEIWIWDKT